MTTLVTGGAGFIGSHLCEKLIRQGEDVICLDNFDHYYDPQYKRANIAWLAQQPEFTLAEVDVRDRQAVRSNFENHKPQRVAHLAAVAGVRASVERAAEYVDVNLGGTISVMDAARSTGVENFLLASTSSIYGASQSIPFSEDQPTDQPLAPYPASKKAAEVMAYAYHNMFGMNITVLRYFTVYGPRVRPDMMAYMVMDKIVRGQKITVFDTPDMQRDWTYIDDICAGVLAALDKPLGYEVMNIGRGQPVRLSEFIEVIEKLTGKQADIELVPTPASEPTITYASVDKAKRLLGYEPYTSVRDGLAHTWEWFQGRIRHDPNQR